MSLIKINHLLKAFGIFFVLLCMNLISYAQTLPPDLPTPPDPCTDPDEYCPIDTQLYVIIIFIIGITLYTTYKHKRKLAVM